MRTIDHIAKPTAQEVCAIRDWMALTWEQQQPSGQETVFVTSRIGTRHLPLEIGA